MEGSRKVEEKVATFKPQDYLNAYEEPDPISPDLTADGQEAHRKISTAFGDEIYAVFSSGNSTDEEIRTDFISKFRPHALKV